MKALEALRVKNYKALIALKARNCESFKSFNGKNYEVSWALRARNNDIVEREDSERRVKREERLGMPK